ncbi:HBR322Cp [Eremothecium sinecaudum]|uniref:Mediator of RNA polymerase II transcription subunit 6 n=1 Tax=Eremothecium sinecaudum TaxID=45286 RepID=A0A109UXD8_9SACH|nr:HBR322Cp [Eremothecium sinecaudum]AMD19223.1 HBR322Cp [Eremothecium sinecaudum]
MTLPLDELQWKSPEWIQSFGLRTDNVLDYFSQSPFFDRTSNNQVVKMQHQFSQQLPLEPTRRAPPDRQHIWDQYPVHAVLERELSRLKGTEYILSHVREPDFWVIRKQLRSSETSVTPLDDYYIIGANVYKSPTAFRIIHNRLLATTLHLSRALEGVQRLSRFQPGQGPSLVAVETSSTPSATTNTTGATIPSTAAATTAAGAISTAVTGAAVETPGAGYQDALTQDLLDKLMLQSLKTTPKYL